MKKKLIIICISVILSITGCADNEQSKSNIIENNFANITKDKLTYEWSEDVKKELLYTSEDGHIVDKQGNIIDAYKNIEVSKDGALMKDGNIIEGYFSGAGGKVYCLYDDSEEETTEKVNNNSLEGTYTDYDTNETITIEKNNDGTYAYYMYANNAIDEVYSDKSATFEDGYLAGRLSCVVINEDKSLSITNGIGEARGNFVKITDDIIVAGLVADEAGICTEVEYDGKYSYMKYDADVLDELLSGAWYDVTGKPLADKLPKTIGNTYSMDAILSARLSNFQFIQGNLDYIRRHKEPSSNYSYAVLIQNVQKINDGYGGIYYQGTEYFSKETVIFQGNFNHVMNGDDLIMFGIYTGMGIDDTVNFKAFFLEFHNDEF